MKSDIAQAVYVILEIQASSLDIKLPSNLGREINLNENFRLTVDYVKPPEKVFFSVTILYKDEVIGSQRQQFNIVSFRVGDYLPALSEGENSVLVKISVYDPDYFVPLVSTFKLQINRPPQGGTLTVTPGTGGVSVSTLFQISASGWVDSDTPLLYQFVYYLSEE